MDYYKNRPYEIVDHMEKSIGRFTIVLDNVSVNGVYHPYSYTKDKGCVIVLPMIENRIIMIHQYRHALNDWFWEIPAGGLGDDEPEIAAKRELQEETGYIPEEVYFVSKYPISLGTSTGDVYYFFAKCSHKEKQKKEALEVIDRVEEVDISSFECMIEKGEYVQREGIMIWMLLQQKRFLNNDKDGYFA